ncbi:hypothetical protein [Paraburkholderia sp.]|uniref:hypothetical protein n=1 Tax=Paraburkholderia sp. TaxID=1926495 RepID=UPI003C71F0C6
MDPKKVKNLNSERNRWLYGYRDSELPLDLILEAGQAMYGRPDAISLYGRTPVEYFPLGVRLMGRTAIECCIDERAQYLAEEAYRVSQRLFPGERPIVIDLFAGSCNLLFHIARRLNAIEALGFESDANVFALTRRNLEIVQAPVQVHHGDYAACLAQFANPGGAPVVCVVSPPWGAGFNYDMGLDLLRTEPPIDTITNHIHQILWPHNFVVLIQTHRKTVFSSAQQVSAGFTEVFDSFEQDFLRDSHVGFLSCANRI